MGALYNPSKSFCLTSRAANLIIWFFTEGNGEVFNFEYEKNENISKKIFQIEKNPFFYT